MNIYHVERGPKDPGDYDQYSDAIVIAPNEARAVEMAYALGRWGDQQAQATATLFGTTIPGDETERIVLDVYLAG